MHVFVRQERGHDHEDEDSLCLSPCIGEVLCDSTLLLEVTTSPFDVAYAAIERSLAR